MGETRRDRQLRYAVSVSPGRTFESALRLAAIVAGGLAVAGALVCYLTGVPQPVVTVLLIGGFIALAGGIES